VKYRVEELRGIPVQVSANFRYRVEELRGISVEVSATFM